MKVVGLKISWNKYLVLPQDILKEHLLRIMLESKLVDTYANKVESDDNVGTVDFIETTSVSGWDKTEAVIQMEQVLAENNRLQRELDKALQQLEAVQSISTSTDLVI